MSVVRAWNISPEPIFEPLTQIELLSVISILSRAEQRVERVVAWRILDQDSGEPMAQDIRDIKMRASLTLAGRLGRGRHTALYMYDMPATGEWRDETSYVWNC